METEVIVLVFTILLIGVTSQNQCLQKAFNGKNCEYKLRNETLFSLYKDDYLKVQCKYKSDLNDLSSKNLLEPIGESWTKNHIKIQFCPWKIFKFIFNDTIIMNNLNKSVKYVTIEGYAADNDTFEFPNIFIEVFPNVKRLDINHLNVKVNSMNQNWPENLHTVEIVGLENSYLPHFINSSIIKMEVHNSEKLVDISNIASLTHLQELKLHGNDYLENLSQGIFINNIALKKLFISSNCAKCTNRSQMNIDETSFEGLNNIEYIQIKYTKLLKIPSNLFKHCPKLQKLEWLEGMSSNCDFPKNFIADKNNMLRTIIYKAPYPSGMKSFLPYEKILRVDFRSQLSFA